MKRNTKTAKKDKTEAKKLRLVREIVVSHLEGVQGGSHTVGPCSGCRMAAAD